MNVASIRAALIAQKSVIDSILAQLDDKQDAKRWMSLADAEKYTGKSAKMLRSMAKAGTIESRWTEGGGKMFVLV